MIFLFSFCFVRVLRNLLGYMCELFTRSVPESAKYCLWTIHWVRTQGQRRGGLTNERTPMVFWHFSIVLLRIHRQGGSIIPIFLRTYLMNSPLWKSSVYWRELRIFCWGLTDGAWYIYRNLQNKYHNSKMMWRQIVDRAKTGTGLHDSKFFIPCWTTTTQVLMKSHRGLTILI